uniref:Ribosome binding factor A n=1 Tax=Rhinolophus ferrumequinum TaxID=59479 RepID=A0A671FWZ1_RHIFE
MSPAEAAADGEDRGRWWGRPERKLEEEEAVGATYCERLDYLLQRSDFVMLAVGLTPQTHGLIGRRELRLMKPLLFSSTLAEIYKPSQLEFPTKSTSKKTKKEDHVRLRALNGLLYKALTDLLCTPQVSQEIYDLNVELSKVSVTWDFSACRVYWKATLSAERDTHAKAVLQRSSTQLRHLLMSQQTLRNVPPIVFIQDKGHAALAEVDRLLAVADFGPPDEKDDVIQNSCRDPEAPDAPPPCDTLGPAVSSSLTGIDHEALSRQIVEYKRRKDKGRGGVSPLWSGPQQVAELTKQKKKRKKCKPCPDNDLSQELPKVGGE